LFVAAGIRARHFDAAFERVTINVTQLRHALRAPLVRNTTSTPVSPLPTLEERVQLYLPAARLSCGAVL